MIVYLIYITLKRNVTTLSFSKLNSALSATSDDKLKRTKIAFYENYGNGQSTTARNADAGGESRNEL